MVRIFKRLASGFVYSAVFAIASLTLSSPSVATESAVCVQQELTKLGYHPGPADGALGRRSVGAANLFASDIKLSLPELTNDTAAQWCTEIQAFAASPASAVLQSRVAQLLPKDVLLDFANAEPEERARLCRPRGSIQLLEQLQPVQKITGFTSRMRGKNGPDSKHVPGARDTERFAEYFGGLAAYAWAADDIELKGKLLDVLQKWANQRAFLDTYVCAVNSRRCTQWTVSDGSDLSRVKDWEFVVNHASGIIRAYFIALADFNPAERKQQHADIAAWIAGIGKMLKRPESVLQVYFTGEVYWPTIVNDYAAGRTSAAHRKLAQIERALDRVILSSDGSIKKATTRGDRALWYHFYGLSMIIPSMEMIRAAGIPISSRVEDRLHKAVALYLDALENPDILDPWARKQRNSKYNGKQDFDFYGWQNFSGGGSWLHVYPYRYSDREEAKRLRALVSTSSKSATGDAFFGIGLGCLYNAAAIGQ